MERSSQPPASLTPFLCHYHLSRVRVVLWWSGVDLEGRGQDRCFLLAGTAISISITATHMFDLATNAQFNPGSCSGDFPTNQGTRIIPAPSVPFNPHFIPIPPLGQRMPSVARPWNYGCLPWLTPGPTDAFRSSPLELRMHSVAHPWSLRASGRHRTSHKTTLKTVWRRSSF